MQNQYMGKRLLAGLIAGAALQAGATSALAANVLFVSDSETDSNIPAVLQADGHTVTTVLNDYDDMTGENTALQASLAGYDVVVWSSTGEGSGDEVSATTAANLESYVNAGGRLFVTGYDSIKSPDDPVLQGLIGGLGGTDDSSGPVPGPVINVVNSLTTGVVDIRGVTPSGGYDDQDTLANLGPNTVCVVDSLNNPGECHWTLRTLGSGEIAYVSNGEYGPVSAHPSWEDTSAGGDGAYNAALRNFVYNAPASAAPIPTVSAWGMVLLSGMLGWVAAGAARRRKV
jgi:hypothetical protein